MGIVFNGTTTRIDCGSATNIDNIFVGGGSVCAWFLANGFGEGPAGRIADKAASTTPTNGWAFFISTAGNDLRFGHGASITQGIWSSPNSTITTGLLYHVAVTFNKDSISNDPILYINGNSVTVTQDAGPSGSFTTDAAQTLSIGNRSASTDRSFDGFIEDVRLYNRILTAGEILTIFTATGHDNITDNLVGRWLMNEGPPGTFVTAASSVIDTSISGNHGTPVNSPFYESSFLSKNRRILRG